MSTQCLVVMTAVLVFFIGHAQAQCGETTIWRNTNRTCPDRAICADVFETVRDWFNGTRCNEKRILHNCLCSGGSACPFSNGDHLLHASAQHKMYTCQSRCVLPFCGNVRQRGAVVSYTAEQNAVEFGGRTYNRMECRCPRHHIPYTARPGVYRSVKAYSHRYSAQTHQFSTLYICDSTGSESEMSDPCPRTNSN